MDGDVEPASSELRSNNSLGRDADVPAGHMVHGRAAYLGMDCSLDYGRSGRSQVTAVGEARAGCATEPDIGPCRAGKSQFAPTAGPGHPTRHGPTWEPRSGAATSLCPPACADDRLRPRPVATLLLSNGAVGRARADRRRAQLVTIGAAGAREDVPTENARGCDIRARRFVAQSDLCSRIDARCLITVSSSPCGCSRCS